MRLTVVALVVGAAAVVLGAPPAAADPAKPTDYRSVITSVAPQPAGLSVEVVGGDAFLEVKVDRGHELVVFAYSAEPFLRIRPDGAVEQNQQSPYTYSIQDRYGRTAPPGINPEGPPEWKTVASGGRYTWHDHRIHWMSPERKPGIEAGDVVQDWAVPMTLDGTEVTVAGELVLEDPVSPVPWFALALAGAAALVVAGRGKSTLVAAIAAAVAGAAALYIGIGEYGNVPEGAGPNRMQVILPAAGLAAAVVAVVAHRSRLAVIGTLAAVAALVAWTIMRVAVFFKPVLPTSLPFGVDRAGTALVIGAAVAAAVLTVRSGALIPTFADLEDDDDDD